MIIVERNIIINNVNNYNRQLRQFKNKEIFDNFEIIYLNFCYNVCINAQKALPLRKIINITTYETTTIAQIRTHDADLR